MKQAINFRLSNKALNVLQVLQKKLHTSKTAIVENALQLYAKKELEKHESILKFAGILSEEEASEMLHSMKSNRKNKKNKNEL